MLRCPSAGSQDADISMTRVKICGITRPRDAVLCAEAGADAIGLVFARSPRQVSVRQARQIVSELPPFVSAVGVFVNARASTIIRTAAELGLSEVQLHGEESPDLLSDLGGLRVIRAMRVRNKLFLDELQRFAKTGIGGVLLDAFSPAARGGSGRRFDLDLVTGARDAGALDGAPPIILAGGLTPQNVRAAIRRLRPWGVDVSSGVESEPGIKSAEKVSRFIAAVRSASL
jgi:phosphoribosylanthranilate isomerase